MKKVGVIMKTFYFIFIYKFEIKNKLFKIEY